MTDDNLKVTVAVPPLPETHYGYVSVPVDHEFRGITVIGGKEIEILTVHKNGDIVLEGKLIANWKDIANRLREEVS